MKNITEYIKSIGKAISKPKSFDTMLTDLIEAETDKVIIAHADNNRDLVYIWIDIDKVYLMVAYTNKTFSHPEILFKAGIEDDMFRGTKYKAKLIKNIESSNHAKILTKFVDDVKNDTTKVCNIYGNVSKAIWQELDKIENFSK